MMQEFGHVYLILLHDYRGYREKIYKIGKTISPVQRFDNHKSIYGKFYIIDSRTFHHTNNVEDFLLWSFSDKRFSGTHHRELFLLEKEDLLVYITLANLIDELEHKALAKNRELFLTIDLAMPPAEFRSLILKNINYPIREKSAS